MDGLCILGVTRFQGGGGKRAHSLVSEQCSCLADKVALDSVFYYFGCPQAGYPTVDYRPSRAW